MVSSQSRSTFALLPFPIFLLGFVLLLLGGGASYLLASSLVQMPLLSRFGLWLLGPAVATVVLSYLLTIFIEEAVWTLLLVGQAIGGLGLLLLCVGLF